MILREKLYSFQAITNHTIQMNKIHEGIEDDHRRTGQTSKGQRDHHGLWRNIIIKFNNGKMITEMREMGILMVAMEIRFVLKIQKICEE
jgi:hypothetical protein